MLSPERVQELQRGFRDLNESSSLIVALSQILSEAAGEIQSLRRRVEVLEKNAETKEDR